MTTVWLNDLEEKVRETAKRLVELRTENATLAARVHELENALAERGAADEGATAWVEEREQIRERVEQLVEHLEDLLGEP